MVALTGLAVAAASSLFGYWKVPIRFYKRWRAKPIEPAVHQIWTECGFTQKDIKWRIIAIKGGWIYVEQLDTEDEEEVKMTLDHSTWDQHIKSKKMFCSDTNDSLHDSYWGKAEE